MATSKRRNKAKKDPVEEYRGKVLAWYDSNKRALPWRATGRRKQEPYKVWLSEVMLQQTTVGAVIPYFTKFLEKWPDVESLAAARQEDVMAAWAGLGYYSRARNLHACAKVIVNDYGGRFPQEQSELKKLPGIGDYTSAAIASIAFDKPATVVDGNVERVMARYYGIEEPLPRAKNKLKELAHELSDGRTDRPGDFAQGMMDLGATVCTPKSPKCSLCPVKTCCTACAAGNAENLPRREAKKDKPQKIGFVYWVCNERRQVLVHRRPEKGMLAGMVGLPTSEWVERKDRKRLQDLPILTAENEKPAGSVYHSFTHFDLQLIPKKAIIKDAALPEGYFWCEENGLRQIGFPTLFDKACRVFNPARS